MTLQKQPENMLPGISPISGFAPPMETRFRPGKSPNPGGIPKSVAHARKLAAKSTPEIIKRMIDIALKSDNERNAIMAGALVLERGLGKVGAMRELYPLVSQTDSSINGLSDDQAARIYAILKEGPNG